MNEVICPKCEVPMIKRKNKFGDSYWWGCRNFPVCRITCAEHPNGTMMSLPALKEVKRFRIKAHALAKKIWGKDKREMYRWIGKNTESNHFGLMGEEEILITIQKMIQLYETTKNS